MLKVYVEYLKPGMILGSPVFGTEGQVLLNSGVKLQGKYITNLKKMGIPAVVIYDERLKDIEVKEVVSHTTRREAISIVKDIAGSSQNNNSLTMVLANKEKKVLDAIENILADLFNNKDTLVNVTDIKLADEYTFAHSVNVAVLSMMSAMSLNFSKKMVREIGIGALLHDMGKVKIPNNILNKPGKLSNAEYVMIKEHPQVGYDIIDAKKVFGERPASVILQHHERHNGQGYPLSKAGNDISQFARVAAVADVYDAMISDRPYRKGIAANEVYDFLSSKGDVDFDLDILKNFLSFVTPYPVGSMVKLSNNQIGFVIENFKGYPLRPRIRVLYEGEELNRLADPIEIILTEKIDIVIDSLIRDPINIQ